MNTNTNTTTGPDNGKQVPFVQPVAADDRPHNNDRYKRDSAIYTLNIVLECKTIQTIKFGAGLTLAGLADRYAKRGHTVELADGGKYFIGNSCLYIDWIDNDQAMPSGSYISVDGFEDSIITASSMINAHQHILNTLNK